MLFKNKLRAQSTGSRGACQARRIQTKSNLYLLRELVRRDFTARFSGSALGIFWAVLQPLTLVALYWFVFTHVFIQRAVTTDDRYVSFLVTGLLPWLALNEGIVRSTTSIVENAQLVRRLTFRSELLVVVPNISAIIFEAIGLTLFLAFWVARGGSVRLLWLLPIALALQFILQLGIGWFVAPTYVVLRDLLPIVGFVLSVTFYLSPILYAVAGKFAGIVGWNPLTPLLGLFRSAMLSVSLPSVSSLVYLVVVACLFFVGGLVYFRRAQQTLADLI
jgi:lipopolysaccharide transport system permease protein